MTRLPNIDRFACEEFWQRFIDAGHVVPGSPMPELIEPFGDSIELADELIELVVNGPKRATASAYAEYEIDGELLPYVGMYSIATDGSGHPRAVLQTTDVRVGPLSSVDDKFAWDEGEGDRTRADWLRGHHDFFRRYLPAAGHDFHPDMATLFERFDVVYKE